MPTTPSNMSKDKIESSLHVLVVASRWFPTNFRDFYVFVIKKVKCFRPRRGVKARASHSSIPGTSWSCESFGGRFPLSKYP